MSSSSNNDEIVLQNEIDSYKEQIKQIDLLLLTNSDNEEFLTLKADLEQLLQLTEESLLEVKKQNLLNHLDLIDNNPAVSSCSFDKNDEHKQGIDFDLNNLEDCKCRVHFECKNTNIKMHNAIVMGIDSYELNTVRVVFTHPTQANMKICEYFINDSCKFDTNCKFSHGFIVAADDLHPYLEPNYNKIKIGQSCLAKHSDDLWHLGTVESIDNENKSVCVQYKKFNLMSNLKLEEVLLLDENENARSEEEIDDIGSDEDLSDTTESSSNESTENEIIQLPNTSKNLNSSVSLGAWESHTKGIGSKLMAKMGYVSGTGLGKLGEGRVEPVEAIVLPEGKMSLDKAMEYKHNKRLLRRRKRKLRNFNNKSAGGANQSANEKNELNVFEFINQKLLNKTKQNETSKNEHVSNKISASTSSASLNLQMLETHNKIQEIEKTITKLKQSLVRNKNSDKATIDHIKRKLEATEKQLALLKKSETNIANEKNNRKKKNEIF